MIFFLTRTAARVGLSFSLLDSENIMPIYEYACGNCDSHFELLQKVSDEPASDCPNCSKPDVRKLVSATTFRLKGSGWYETDFKDNKSKTAKDKTTTIAKTTEPTKTDTKVDKKTPKASVKTDTTK